MIYFIQAEIIGRIKIGCTKAEKIGIRLKSLQVGSPVKLELLAVMDGGKRTERLLHERFSAYRVHGEWFRMGKRLVQFVARLQGKWKSKNRSRKMSRKEHAVAWMALKFKDRREWGSEELFSIAIQDKISRNAIFEAKEELGIKVRKTQRNGVNLWIWEWPDKAVEPAVPETP